MLVGEFLYRGTILLTGAKVDLKGGAARAIFRGGHTTLIGCLKERTRFPFIEVFLRDHRRRTNFEFVGIKLPARTCDDALSIGCGFDGTGHIGAE